MARDRGAALVWVLGQVIMTSMAPTTALNAAEGSAGWGWSVERLPAGADYDAFLREHAGDRGFEHVVVTRGNHVGFADVEPQ